MEPPDPIAITLQVAELFDALGIPYLLGGSLASIVHGMLRTTLDADLVAEIEVPHARPFSEHLAADFWVEVDSILGAIQHKSSFSLIHRASTFKVDVFVSRRRPFDLERFRRREAIVLIEAPEQRAWVSTAEDIVLAKLEWFEMGDRVSERQWRDVLGVIRMQGAALDLPYLQRWATSLGVEALLALALEAGSEAE